MNIEIVKFDNLGRGIGYVDNKIIFIPKSVPGDVVNVEVKKNKKNYLEGEVLEVVRPSKMRIEAKCPYFDICGGCDLMHISISEALEYKLNKVNDILLKNNISYSILDIIKSDSYYNYRNKVTLKIVDKRVGYFQSNTHELVEVNNCLICNEVINNLIEDIQILNINNGEIVIRVNYNGELLIFIKSEDNIENIDYLINNYKIIGIIKNEECIYGDNFLIDKINDYLFKVSYDSFFQVNPFICSKLFDLVLKNTKDSTNVLDLYCGVGTLSIVASKNAKSVMGVEIVENSIIDANLNKILNKSNNIEFICDDTLNVTSKITKDFDTIILDPPRSGVSLDVINKIIHEKINKIIYVSCDANTLARDLKLLENSYEIKEFKLLDMFPNSEHVESFVVLTKK